MHTRWNSFVRNATLATVLLAGLYGLRAVAPLDTILLTFNPLRVTTILGIVYPEPFEPVVFIAELCVLGLLGTTAAHLVHRWTTDDQHASWHLGVAGALSMVGVHWVKWAIQFAGTTHTETDSVVITGVLGLILLGLAGWFAGTGTKK